MIDHIMVAGLGKLGLPVAVTFATHGVKVIGYDLDEQKVRHTHEGHPAVEEPGLPEALQKAMNMGNLTATTNVCDAVAGSQACIFMTPTPSHADGSFDNRFLLDALGKVAHEVFWHRPVKRAVPYVFIIGSTVTPGSCDREFVPLLETHGNQNYHLVYKPELIALGTVIEDLQHPDVMLVGASSEQARTAVYELYGRIVSAGMISKTKMSFIEAELAKISLNCAVTQKISLANQIGMVAEKLGANPQVVLMAVGADRRIGHRYLKPGLPFAGPCFPRDNRMFQHVAARLGMPACLSAATDQINEYVIRHILEQVPAIGDVGILGQAYKPGTCVTDESPGIKLRDALLAAGRTVKTHDFSADHGHDFAEVLRCPTIIVATAWPGYADIRPRLIKDSVLIDPMGIVRERQEPESFQCLTPHMHIPKESL